MSAQIDRRIFSNKCIARSNGKLSKITRLVSFSKHCQRHNGPEGWVLRIKVTSLGQITSSYKTLDQTYLELHNHMKHQQQNNDQTSASKSCLNINFKILTKLWNLVLKVWTKTYLYDQITFQICNKMLSTCFWLSTWATVTISTIFELSSSEARATSIKFTQ